jgi:hypothetical protein
MRRNSNNDAHRKTEPVPDMPPKRVAKSFW